MIRDLARNNLDPAAAEAQFLGYRSIVTEPFSHDLYRMLIKPIREDDKVSGNEFLKRFLIGPQLDFGRTYSDIRNIKRLCNYRTTQGRFLPYLLHLLGFNNDSTTAHVTVDLNELDRRRLVYAAAPIWKTKGTEEAYDRAALLLGGIRMEIDDWFYYRWIALDEGILGEDRLHTDPWIVTSPGLSVEPDEFETDIAIMEESGIDLNRKLVVDMLELSRPSSERLNVYFVEYLDSFADSQDVAVASGNYSVKDGVLTHLVDNTITVAKVVGSDEWENPFAAWQIRVFEQTKGDPDNKARLLFHYLNVNNYDFIELNFGLGHGTATVMLGRRQGGVESTLATCGFSVDFDANTDYVWRIQVNGFEDPVTFEGKRQIKVLRDQDEIIVFQEVLGPFVPTKGNIGEQSFKAHLKVSWKETFQWPLVVETLRPKLLIKPHYEAIAHGSELTFTAIGGGGIYKYSLQQNMSGATIEVGGRYIAGPSYGTGIIDIVEVADQFGKRATAFVDVT